MFMLILTDDDFSHLYIPAEQIKTVSIFFLCPIMKNPRGPTLISKNQVSAMLSLIMNIKTFVVSNPPERPGYHISMKKRIERILNYGLNCIKISINSCIHY